MNLKFNIKEKRKLKMEILAIVFVSIVALEHVYIMIMEMFMWESKGPSVFGLEPNFAKQTKSLAANQGLYNGFLAAGLVWGLVHPNATFGHQLILFFLICVIVAAVYGALTSNKSILIKQGFPAILALIVVLL